MDNEEQEQRGPPAPERVPQQEEVQIQEAAQVSDRLSSCCPAVRAHRMPCCLRVGVSPS